jgi:heme/copper-type cytochrome/quinol oxidase subunit 3
MLASIVLLVVSTVFSYRDYRRGKAAKGVFKRMLGITVLIGILMVFVLIIDFGGIL